ncbi:PAS domain S-box protein [Falsiroseomonas sp. E2-1-a20]|uniref:PAS domain S-box protein n=1 Tax=Falsiroseomonas sp. E2-1-a20 TaxID=3239300 RepID=UPI003F36BA78
MDAETGPVLPKSSFLAGGGEMGARTRAYDWSASPLGPPEHWAQPLKTLVSVMLAANQPMFIAWGAGRTLLYNDGYAGILGLKQPTALGQPFDQVWSEIWGELEPIMSRCYAGEPIQMDDIMLVMHRHGYPEETHFAFSYTPVRDDAGQVAGVFCPCTEITAKVLADRRQAFRHGLETRLRDLTNPKEVMAAAAEALGRHLDTAQVGYAEVGMDGHATTGGEFQDGRILDFRAGRYRIEDYGPVMAADMAAGRVVIVHDVREDPRTSSPEALKAYAAISLRAFIIVPLVKEGRLTAYLYAAHPEPRRWSEEEVKLICGVAEQTWSAVERARAEAALRESEARFRLMADAVPQIVWIVDAKGRNEFYNEQWFAYTGASRESTDAAQTVAHHVHRDDQASTIARFEEAQRTEDTFIAEHRIRSKDGDYRWFLVRGEPHRDPRTGMILRWFGTSVDIHDRKSAEEANARLAAIVASTTDAIIAFAAEDGRILAWNRGAEELFGYTEAEALGGPVGLLVPPDLPDGDPTGVFRRAMEGARVHEHETTRVTKSGERIPVAVTASRMLAPSGRAIGVAAIFRDLRQRKAVEARQALLSREVDHRAKNALAVVQAALRLTRAPDLPSYVRAISGRVTALARAQTLLADERWAGADLGTMLTAEMDAFLSDEEGGEPRATLVGPSVALPAGAAQPLAMAVHELATNATKHGALSAPGGCVAVTWSLDDGLSGTLRLRWAETGGPPIKAPPTRQGFGTRVLDRVLRGQLGGTLSLAWNKTGLVCDIELPLARMTSASASDLAGDQAGSWR